MNYSKDTTWTYGGVTGIRVVGEKTLNGTPHVVLQDREGNQKLIYKDLFDKYAVEDFHK